MRRLFDFDNLVDWVLAVVGLTLALGFVAIFLSMTASILLNIWSDHDKPSERPTSAQNALWTSRPQKPPQPQPAPKPPNDPSGVQP